MRASYINPFSFSFLFPFYYLYGLYIIDLSYMMWLIVFVLILRFVYTGAILNRFD